MRTRRPVARVQRGKRAASALRGRCAVYRYTMVTALVHRTSRVSSDLLCACPTQHPSVIDQLKSRLLLQRLGALRTRHNGRSYYGWVVVAVSAMCAMLSAPGQSFLLSLYVDSLIADLGLSRVAVASLYGACTLAAAACLPLVGHVADRVSSRAFLTTVVLLLAAGLGLLASAQNVTILALALFTLRLLGQGAIGLGTMTTTVRWFARHRSRALAIVALGYPVGEMVFPAIVVGLMAVWGWRGSLLAIAAAYAVLFAPLVARLMRQRKSPLEPLDGRLTLSRETEKARQTDAGVRTPTLTTGEFDLGELHSQTHSFAMRQAVRIPVFWGALLCGAAMPVVVTGVIFHQVALFQSVEWPAALVPVAFLAAALCGVGANLATAFVLERMPPHFGLIGANLLGLAALAAMLSPLPPALGVIAYGALLGTAGGTASATNAVLWPGYFGTASLGAIKGVVSAVRNAATAMGPPLVAALISSADSAFAPLVGVGSLLALAATGAVFLRPPRSIDMRADAGSLAATQGEAA